MIISLLLIPFWQQDFAYGTITTINKRNYFQRIDGKYHGIVVVPDEIPINTNFARYLHIYNGYIPYTL